MSFDLPALRSAVAHHGRVARIVVIRQAGSVPREAGTEMLVWKDGQSGTIGGGALEFKAVGEARMMFAAGGRRRIQVPLGPAVGQCCGGAVTLAVEVFDAANLPDRLPYARAFGPSETMPDKVAKRAATIAKGAAPVEIDGWLIEAAEPEPRPLWIYGAGHVGRALVNVMAPLPDLAITWIDIAQTRFPDEIPQQVVVLPVSDMAKAAVIAPEDADHLILTFSHDLDLALCHALLGRRFASIGLIGSATKWARFKSRLATLGHSREQISRIICPIGDTSLGKHPAALALGVATAFLVQDRTKTKDRTG